MSRPPAAAAIVLAAALASAAACPWPAAAATSLPAPAWRAALTPPALSMAALRPLALSMAALRPPALSMAVPPAPASSPAVPPAPGGVHARGAELADATTGKRLWSRGLNGRRPMASITKVMTALVVIRAGHLGQKIRISDAVVAYARQNADASIAGLHAADVLTVRQLLEGMLLPSGSDAAFALASAYGRGWRAFVGKMNATAVQLGMTGTHYANFDGLPWPTEHSTYSTPHDLVILGDAAMKSATFRDIVRQRSYRIGATAQHHRYRWRTTNLLLGSYPGAVGIKTGSTRAAGYCLLFEARHGRATLIGVVLDSSATDSNARFTDAARLLNWAFGLHVQLRIRSGAAGVAAD